MGSRPLLALSQWLGSLGCLSGFGRLPTHSCCLLSSLTLKFVCVIMLCQLLSYHVSTLNTPQSSPEIQDLAAELRARLMDLHNLPCTGVPLICRVCASVHRGLLMCRSRKFLPGFWFGGQSIGAILIGGRLLAASVEGWVLFQHLQATLQQDVQARKVT